MTAVAGGQSVSLDRGARIHRGGAGIQKIGRSSLEPAANFHRAASATARRVDRCATAHEHIAAGYRDLAANTGEILRRNRARRLNTASYAARNHNRAALDLAPGNNPARYAITGINNRLRLLQVGRDGTIHQPPLGRQRHDNTPIWSGNEAVIFD